MAEVNWINGTINPPESGGYYVIEEAQMDIRTERIKEGDIEITTDYFDASTQEWDELGKDNPYWKVLSWAKILYPNIPNDLSERVTRYFGESVKKNG